MTGPLCRCTSAQQGAGQSWLHLACSKVGGGSGAAQQLCRQTCTQPGGSAPHLPLGFIHCIQPLHTLHTAGFNTELRPRKGFFKAEQNKCEISSSGSSKTFWKSIVGMLPRPGYTEVWEKTHFILAFSWCTVWIQDSLHNSSHFHWKDLKKLKGVSKQSILLSSRYFYTLLYLSTSESRSKGQISPNSTSFPCLLPMPMLWAAS